jgi:hypothetical protein
VGFFFSFRLGKNSSASFLRLGSDSIVQDGSYKLSGEGTIATYEKNKTGARDFATRCLTIGPPLAVGSFTHTISFKCSHTQGRVLNIGVVCDGAGFTTQSQIESGISRHSKLCRFFEVGDGILQGHGEHWERRINYDSDDNPDNYDTGIWEGEVLTVQVDLAAGYFRLWKDGKPHGPSYESGVKGPLRFAMIAKAEGRRAIYSNCSNSGA